MATTPRDAAPAVRRILSEILGVNVEQVTDDKKLATELGADSLDLIEIVMALEDEFEIEITDEDATKFIDQNGGDVKSVISYIARRLIAV